MGEIFHKLGTKEGENLSMMNNTEFKKGGQNYFGPHLMLDLGGCDKKALESLDLIFDILNQLPDKIGMTKITQPYVFKYNGVVPDDWGITGTVIIAESHISIHTFPEKNYVFIDLFSCKPFNIERAKRYLMKIFNSKKPIVHEVARGMYFPRSSEPNIPLTPLTVRQ